MAMSGVMKSATKAVTTAPNAAPMTTPTARSTTLPRSMNSLKSLSIGALLCSAELGHELVHVEVVTPRRDLSVGDLEHAHHGKRDRLCCRLEDIDALGQHDVAVRDDVAHL